MKNDISNPHCDISVVIITFNEEQALATCLASLPAGAEIIVLDSHSSDRTTAIAAAARARVYSRPFSNYAEQKNAALSYATRSWVLSLDADEELSPALAQQLVDLAQGGAPAHIVGYALKRNLEFLGRRLRFGHTGDYPLRFFRRGAGSFVGALHERLVVEGTSKRVHKAMLHRSYRDLSDYFTKFNRYTSQAAAIAHTAHQAPPSEIMLLLRCFSTFVQRYFLRLGALDGPAGFYYACLSSLYVYTKYTKLRELS